MGIGRAAVTYEALTVLLGLREGCRVARVEADRERNMAILTIEGPTMPECVEGQPVIYVQASEAFSRWRSSGLGGYILHSFDVEDEPVGHDEIDEILERCIKRHADTSNKLADTVINERLRTAAKNAKNHGDTAPKG